MIMPRASDQLLMPVSPLFVWSTLLVALLIDIVPLGRVPAMPDFLALVLVFWNVHQSRRVGVGIAFAFGLLIDVHSGAVLGQHALAYTLAQLLRGDDPPAAALVHGAVAGGADPAALLRRAGGLARRPPDRRRHVPGLAAAAGAGVPGASVARGHLAAARAAAPRPRPGRKSAACDCRAATQHRARRSRAFACACVAAALFVLFAFGLLVARPAATCRSASTRSSRRRPRTTASRSCRSRPTAASSSTATASSWPTTTRPTRSRSRRPRWPTSSARSTRSSEIVEIQPRDRKRFKRLLDESRSVESLPIRTRLSDEEVARFTAQRFRFEGVDIKARLFRSYPLGEVGSHLIGYIGRINPTEKKQMEDDWADDDLANYRGTEYIGKLGIEQSYESELHGQTGFEEVEMSAGGHAVRRLKSNPATPGNAVVLSIDIRLQAMVEELFGDRRGALVAIDPRNGEILAFVSKPNFDPNLFVDGIDVENWRALNDSPDKPLLNRALRGTYPPGSTYKPFMALAALDARQAHAAADDLRPGLLQLRQPPLPRRQGRRPRHGRHVQVDRPVVRHLLLHARQRPRRRRDPRLHGAARLRPHHRHRHAGRAARHAAVDRVEARRLPEEGSAEVVRRRDHLARHRPGLQHLHDAAAGAGRRRPSPPAASASRRTSCARSRTTRRAPPRRVTFPALAPLALEARSTSPSSTARSTASRRKARRRARSSTRPTSRAARPARRR